MESVIKHIGVPWADSSAINVRNFLFIEQGFDGNNDPRNHTKSHELTRIALGVISCNFVDRFPLIAATAAL
jgi:hypothetical protein